MAQVGFALKLNQALPGNDYSTDRVPVPGDAIATQTALLATAQTAVTLVQTESDLAMTAVATLDTDVDAALVAVQLVDTRIDLAVTADATILTDYDIFGAALVAITGDTYSNVTHQWTTGGSTGLTHAQVVTLMALLNTTATAILTAQTATVLTQTGSDLAVTAATLVQTDSDLAVTAVTLTDTKADLAVTATNAMSFGGITAVASGDAMLIFDGSKVTTKNQARITGRRLVDQASNSASFT